MADDSVSRKLAKFFKVSNSKKKKNEKEIEVFRSAVLVVKIGREKKEYRIWKEKAIQKQRKFN